MHQFLVIVEKADGNYSAYSPDLPGCVAAGKSREEGEERMHEAIGFTSLASWKTASRYRSPGLRPSTWRFCRGIFAPAIRVEQASLWECSSSL